MKYFGIAFLCLGLITGCGQASQQKDSQQKRQIAGTIVPSDEGQRLVGYKDGDLCPEIYNTGSYSDLATGGSVKVKNAKGEIIAIGKLTNGKVKPFQGALYCFKEFQVSDVPDSDFYSISVGTRNDLTFSRDELEKKNWSLELVIK
ncbi:hypothetical protein TUMEXPCC7403_25255 [Tumidithrix helvetica PCC 7403]|uniref:hypothetical protein n=1 Tax=Tumidithrix helvetica TaxID=3457545 RepID=UPI003CB1087A